MIDTPELGYTPKNLKALRQNYNLTQQDVGTITNTSWRTVARWELGLERKGRADMPYTKWAILITSLLENPKSSL